MYVGGLDGVIPDARLRRPVPSREVALDEEEEHHRERHYEGGAEQLKAELLSPSLLFLPLLFLLIPSTEVPFSNRLK